MHSVEAPAAIPQEISLATQRSEILKLKGASEYIPPGASESETENGITTLIAEVKKELDAVTMAHTFFPHYFAWSDEKTNEFLDTKDHKPFKSKITFENEPEELKSIAKYLVLKYTQQKAQPGEESQKKAAEIGLDLSMFYAYSLTKLYLAADNDFTNNLVDVKNSSRRTDSPIAGPEIIATFSSEVQRVTVGNGLDSERLLTRVLKITDGGYIKTIPGLLKNYDLDDTTRTILENVYIEKTKNERFIKRKLQLFYQAEKYREEIGLDLDLLYEINGLKSNDALLSSLRVYLLDEKSTQKLRDLINEALKDTPPNFKISYFDLLKKRAKALGLSTKVETDTQRKEKVIDSEKYLKKNFPFLIVDDRLSQLITTTAFGAETRGVNGTYPNQKDEIVKVIGLDPRMIKNRFISIEGHERTHQLHAVILERLDNLTGQQSKSYESLPTPVHEAFTHLVQNQLEQILKSEIASGKKSKDSSQLFEAIEINEAIMTTYMQYTIRRLVTDSIRPDKESLSDMEIKDIYEEVRNGLNNLNHLSTVTFPNLSIATLDPLFIFDGLSYLSEHILDVLLHDSQEDNKKNSTSPDKDSLVADLENKPTLKSAFENRFGDVWLRLPDAQIIFCAALAYTQNTTDILELAAFIQNADIETEREKLNTLGISIQTPEPTLAQ